MSKSHVWLCPSEQLLGYFFQNYLYGRDVARLAFLTQDLGADSDFFDAQLALEKPAPDHFAHVHGMADRLSPGLHRQMVLASVEVHHYRRGIGHQRFLTNKHSIGWYVATRFARSS